MYFSIHYENGTSSFEQTISLPVSNPDVVVEAMTNFIKTVFEPAEVHHGKPKEEARAELHEAVEEILSDMYGYYDE
jgi:hypothetical protein